TRSQPPRCQRLSVATPASQVRTSQGSRGWRRSRKRRGAGVEDGRTVIGASGAVKAGAEMIGAAGIREAATVAGAGAVLVGRLGAGSSANVTTGSAAI